MLIATLCILAVGGITAHGAFLKLLRERAPECWEELGRPSLILNNSVANSMATQRFILSGGFKVLPDSSLRRLGTFLRWFAAVYMLVFAVILIRIGAQAAA